MKSTRLFNTGAVVLSAAVLASCGSSESNTATQDPPLGALNAVALPTGQTITPTLAPLSTFVPLNPGLAAYPNLNVSQAVSQVLSADGTTLAVLTTGYNKLSDPATGKPDPNLQSEFIFMYDVSTGKPVQKQAIQVPNTWAGIACELAGT